MESQKASRGFGDSCFVLIEKTETQRAYVAFCQSLKISSCFRWNLLLDFKQMITLNFWWLFAYFSVFLAFLTKKWLFLRYKCYFLVKIWKRLKSRSFSQNMQLYSSFSLYIRIYMGFPGGSVGKESACNAGDLGSIPGLGKCPGGGHGNPCQYSGLENPMDRGAWRAAVHGVTRSRTQLIDYAQHIYIHTHFYTNKYDNYINILC